MVATEIEFSTPVLAYQAIRRKLLSLRRRKPTVDGVETNTGRSAKRRREFGPPEVIKRLSGDDFVRKVGVMASVHVGENGTAVFLMPLHGKASESLTSLLETFHSVQATQKPVVDGPLTSATVDVTPHVDGVAAGGESGPTAVPESPLLEGTEPIAASYSSDSSSETVEGPELDPDRGDVFGPIDFNDTRQPKERLTSVSSEMSVVSNTTVIWVGSLTPVPAQAGPSRTDMHFKRPPSEITVDWQDASTGEQDEELTEGNASPLSISPGSPKTMHVKTPGQSGMPSPNVEIYSIPNTPKETHSNPFHPTKTPVEGKTVVTIPNGTDSQERQVASEGCKKQERPVVPFFYGSKIPVMTAKPSGYKNTYGSLIAHQRCGSVGDIPSTNPKPSVPKPHSCTATPLAPPRPRALSRTQTAPVRVLTRRDTITGHFPGTPPKPTVTTVPTSGGSPRPRSSSKIPIPSPTTPKAIIPEGKKLKDILTFGESMLGDIAEADCENDAIWERRRDDVMGPLGVSPTTRLGGFLRPASMAKNPRVSSMPMASLVGTAMASNDVTKS